MSNDRKLLELAAKAAGEITPSWYGNQNYLDGVLGRWNPLTDDGDALRLAVKLELSVSTWGNAVSVWQRIGDTSTYETTGKDRMASTRRVIVRAAAEIGKQIVNSKVNA